MGTQQLDSWTIEQTPTADGTINELLKSNPNVQFSNANRTGLTMGEIAPENVSFHGERFYNNNWMIDGISNNDNTNPAANGGYVSKTPDGAVPSKLPDSGTQSFWLSSDSVDSVVVYDSNISAKYGQFTGGVIDAKLKNADTEKQTGSISYRTTRDEWTKFNIYGKDAQDVADNTEDFKTADRLYYQPQFTKNIYQFNINQPINDKTAVMFTYNRTDSTIPLYDPFLDNWRDQKRLAENFMLKGIYEADGGDTLKLTAMYSPHSSKYYKRAAKDSSYTVEGGGYRINLEWEHLFDNGTVKTYLGYRNTTNTVEHEANNWYTWKRSNSINWGTSRSPKEGGYGTWTTDKKTLTVKQDFEFDPITWGTAEHKISAGWKADWAKAGYDRDKDSTMYTTARLDSTVVCNAGDTTCVDGEQWIARKTVITAKSVDVDNSHASLYLEDQIKWKNLELTPGVRIDWDEFLGNTNVAPRFTASYDIFGDKKTRVFGGLNRYYADSMLSFALRNKIGYNDYYATKRTYDEAWSLKNGYENGRMIGGNYVSSNVKTPYSDEINLGISQQIMGTEWVAKWVNRKGKDQFARTYWKEDSQYKRNDQWYSLNNNGHSEADTFTLTGRVMKPIEWEHATLSWNFGASYSKNKSNFDYYEDTVNDETDAKKIIIDGKLKNYGEVEAMDYNTPWRAFANINIDFPQWYLNWSNTLNYTAGYNAWSTDNIDCSDATERVSGCGSYTGDATLYEKVKYNNRFTLDWRFSYAPPIASGNLNISLDVLNVLNTKVEGRSATGSETINYKPGRQFWLGVKYAW